MKSSFTKKELDDLLVATRAAGRAEGYAQAKYEMALERASADASGEPPSTNSNTPTVYSDDLLSRAAKVNALTEKAQKAEEENVYKTRTTVTMTRTIALEYIKSVAPRVVGPSEIKKNSEKDLSIFISFGTLKRAMSQLVEMGEVEQIEESRWRAKSRSDGAMLRALK